MSRLVIMESRPPVTLTGFDDEAQSFTVNMSGMDTLILNTKFTHASGTALTIGFTGPDMNEINEDYDITITDYAAKAIDDGPFTYPKSGSISGDFRKRFVFSMPALAEIVDGLGNITVTIGVTAADTGDAMTITPYVARFG